VFLPTFQKKRVTKLVVAIINSFLCVKLSFKGLSLKVNYVQVLFDSSLPGLREGWLFFAPNIG